MKKSLLLLLLLRQHRVVGVDKRGIKDNLLGVYSSYDQEPSKCCPQCTDSERRIHDSTSQEAITKIENDTTGREFFGTFQKLGISWLHIVRSYIRIIGLAGGKEQNDDVRVKTMEIGLIQLQELTREMDFSFVPYNVHGHSLEHLFRVFLVWSSTNGSSDDTTTCPHSGGVNGRHESINVSMAFRRLQMYSEWIQQVLEDDNVPITDDSVRVARETFAMQLEYDACERLVWRFDLRHTDLDGVKSLPSREINRFFVWMTHLILFDERAQKNGIVFVNNMNRIGLFSFLTMLELKVGIKLDEYMICVVPLNTKLVVFLNTPSWAEFGYGILSVFLNKDMKSRVRLISNGRDQQALLNDILGSTRPFTGFENPAQTSNTA